MYSTGGWTELVTESNNVWTKNAGDIYKSVGNVGIGLSTPTDRLHVHVSLSSSNFLRLTNSGTGLTATDGLALGANGVHASLMNKENGLLVIGTANDSALYLTNAGGNPRFGIGWSTPTTPLDVKLTGGISGNTARFNAANGLPMYAGIYENDIYRGYWGSFSGNAEDVDFGTGGGNTSGKLHLTIQAVPKLTINAIGNVGIGSMNPVSNAKLHVAGDSLNTAYFTSTHNQAFNSAILKTEALLGVTDLNATGIEIAQNGTQGRGRGLFVRSGYVGAEIYSLDAAFATQNYGVIVNASNDADAWGLYGTAGGTGVLSTKIGVFGSASGGGTNWAFYGLGNAFLSGGTWQTSDEKFKTNILPISNASSRLLQLIPRQYEFDTNQYAYLNLPSGSQQGFLASNMQEVFPEMVKKVKVYKERPAPDKTNESIEFNAVNYTALIPVLTQAINEHTAEIIQLKKIVEEYKALLMEQKKIIEQLKAPK